MEGDIVVGGLLLDGVVLWRMEVVVVVVVVVAGVQRGDR